MAKKDRTLTSKFIVTLLNAGDVLSYIIGAPRTIAPIWKGKPSSFRTMLYQLQRQGVIKVIDKNNQRFISLTHKGQLEALFAKSILHHHPKKWDGKWRMVLFDIPQESSNKRDFLRHLLHKQGFIKLQGSIYINPWPINREAISYLKESGLMDYIRIAKIEEMDNDTDLRKKFKFN